MGAFNGLGPRQGHWFPPEEILRQEENNKTPEDEGYYVSYNYFFPHGIGSSRGHWGTTGDWFDTLEEAEAAVARLEAKGRKPVRWYEHNEDKK